MIALLCLGASADQLFQPMMRGAQRAAFSPVEYAPQAEYAQAEYGRPATYPVYESPVYTQVEEESSGWAGVGSVVLFGLVAAAAWVRPKTSPSFGQLALLG